MVVSPFSPRRKQQKRRNAISPKKSTSPPKRRKAATTTIASPSPPKRRKAAATSPTKKRATKSPSPSDAVVNRRKPQMYSSSSNSSPRYAFRPPPIQNERLPLKVSSSSLDKRIKTTRIVIFGRADCGWCRRAKEFFDGMNVKYAFVDITDPNVGFTREEMVLLNEITAPTETVPRIFVDGVFVGGFADTTEKIKNGSIKI